MLDDRYDLDDQDDLDELYKFIYHGLCVPAAIITETSKREVADDQRGFITGLEGNSWQTPFISGLPPLATIVPPE